MDFPPRLRFGAFLAPFHRLGEHPTLALRRDLELIDHLDLLGFDEVWIGEHHSAAWEIISSPEIMIAASAERTKHIKLGTGVVSLPYHHPFMVAERLVLLDHLTRGRVLFGVGPGAIPNDARMLGVDPGGLAERFETSLEAVVTLLTRLEPVSRSTEGFTLKDALLQLRSYTRPHPPLYIASSFSGRGVKTAARYGAGVLQLGAGPGTAERIRVAEAEAGREGHKLDRSRLLLVLDIFLADSQREATEAVRELSAAERFEYWTDIVGLPEPDYPPGVHVEHLIESGRAIVGTPDACVAALRRLYGEVGGFGGVMIGAKEWARPEQVKRSYELFARYVMPELQDVLSGLRASRSQATSAR